MLKCIIERTIIELDTSTFIQMFTLQLALHCCLFSYIMCVFKCKCANSEYFTVSMLKNLPARNLLEFFNHYYSTVLQSFILFSVCCNYVFFIKLVLSFNSANKIRAVPIQNNPVQNKLMVWPTIFLLALLNHRFLSAVDKSKNNAAFRSFKLSQLAWPLSCILMKQYCKSFMELRRDVLSVQLNIM